MREIKFRAWDKDNKRMFTVAEYMPPEAPAFVGALRDSNLDKDYPLTAVELMQYTGLKDKNGKEIYEGDIAKVTGKEDQTSSEQDINNLITYTELGVMQFNDKESQFSFFMKDSLFIWPMEKLTVEVIGNVYENPELLK